MAKRFLATPIPSSNTANDLAEHRKIGMSNDTVDT